MPSLHDTLVWALSNSAWAIAMRLLVAVGALRILTWIWKQALDWRREIAFWIVVPLLTFIVLGASLSSSRGTTTAPTMPDLSATIDRFYAYRLGPTRARI